MGVTKKFEIIFTNPTPVYYSENVIKGHVQLELNEPLSFRGIVLKFAGKGNVRWTEQRSAGKTTYTVTFSSHEKYFSKEILLHGIWSNQGRDTTELSKGEHKFPFEFQLPQKLPSSFEGDHGHVRYTVSCVVDRPWKFDKKTKRPFTVLSILDLNDSKLKASESVKGENQKHLCCLCCKSGPIQASFHIDRRGYVPGEAIKLFAEISNGATRRMKQSYIDLRMVTHFHATSKTRTVVKEVARVSRPSISGHSEDSWNGEQLVIPPIAPSFLEGCNIIDVHYILQLNVDPAGPAFDLEVPLSVIIGNVPLASVVQQQPPLAPSAESTSNWVTPGAPTENTLYPRPPPTGIPNLPPPSYGESITGRVDIHEDDDNQHTTGNLSYAPQYTYYNWGFTPAPLPS